ncbi:MAG: MTAP family purine nucleoside phosphorylase, partial [Candidatus Altiarchaeota archaeon]|nr:MTAP family purine nucleoside phosphorylase [Candidatus Altiarchaeota archaeon]
MVKVGVIGGSGLDDPNILGKLVEKEVKTEYGKPTSSLTEGVLGGVNVILIARHGRNHQYSPTEVNYRANIQAFKDEGVTHILATTACGSLREEIDRGHFVILDQFIDFTKHRKNTFVESFEGGAVHTPMAHPFDEGLRSKLIKTSKELGYPHHEKGTVVTIEGPRFSTVAESKMFRLWGADVINMSVATEVALANELKIPYAAVAMSTDYDCW